jgi:hypothetical protein
VAAFASIENLSTLPELGQRGSQRRRSRRRAQLRGELPEKPSMRRAAALAEEAPGVGGFVSQRVLLRPVGQVCGDRDAVGIPVDDLTSGELARRKPHDCGPESEAGGEPIVEKLEVRLSVRFGNREERVRHRD